MKRKLISFFLFLILLFSFSSPVLLAEDSREKELSELEDEISELREKIAELGAREETLEGQISYMDSEIQLTSLKINQTQNRIELLKAQIDSLTDKIGILDISLNEVSVLFINRVVASYKTSRIQPLELIFASDNFSDFFKRAHYLRVAQINDRETLLTMEQIRSDYDHQKQEKEQRQQELEMLQQQLAEQKAQLDAQKRDKEYLLEVTRNDEKRYQEMLAQARSEYQAIQAILAGRGDEVEVGEVSKGDVIATLINSASCSSTGAHLHFTIKNNGNTINPFDKLKSVDHDNQTGGDPFNPSGDWDWPMSPTITLTQGYGDSSWVRSVACPAGIYCWHSGIDIKGSSLNVYTVADGVLYRGSYSISYDFVTGQPCNLPYVRVEHNDSSMSTYYLHINYVAM